MSEIADEPMETASSDAERENAMEVQPAPLNVRFYLFIRHLVSHASLFTLDSLN